MRSHQLTSATFQIDTDLVLFIVNRSYVVISWSESAPLNCTRLHKRKSSYTRKRQIVNYTPTAEIRDCINFNVQILTIMKGFNSHNWRCFFGKSPLKAESVKQLKSMIKYCDGSKWLFSLQEYTVNRRAICVEKLFFKKLLFHTCHVNTFFISDITCLDSDGHKIPWLSVNTLKLSALTA